MFSSARLIITLIVLLPAAVHAQPAGDRVLASYASGAATVNVDRLLAEALQLPPQAQSQLLVSRPEIGRFAQSILVRGELARQAEAQGLQDDPKVAAALRAARERVLAEALLAKAEGGPPDAAALERLARNQYDAAPQKFDTPEQIRVRHILVGAKTCDAEGKARDLLAQARQPGADFAALAKANSDDPGSGSRGGDLGFFTRGKMAPAFESAAFALKQPGDLSDVIRTEFGFHVIRLEERRPAARQPFESVKGSLVKGLAETQGRSRRQQVVDKITAEVRLDPDAIEALAAAGEAKTPQ